MGNPSAQFLLPFELERYQAPRAHLGLVAKRLAGLDRDAAYAAILAVLRDIAPVALRTTPFTDPEPPFPGSSTAPTAATTSATPCLWPARCATFVPDLANRHDEFDFFVGTLSAASAKRATLISAESNHGKTKLVA